MKALLLFLVLPFVLGITLAQGAVVAVDPSQDLQTVINNANSGDDIILADGVYQSVLINNKSINISGISGTPQIVHLQVSNSPSVSQIKNIRVTSDINSTTGLIQLNNCRVDGNINAFVSSIKLVNTTVVGNANFYGGEVGAKTIILRSSIGEKLSCDTENSKIFYSQIRYAAMTRSSEIVGNVFNGRGIKEIGIDLAGATTFSDIYNNRIHNYRFNSGDDDIEKFIGIRIKQNASANIVNNLIYDIQDTAQTGTESKIAMGIFVEKTQGTKILGNIFWGIYANNLPSSVIGNTMIYAPNEKVSIANNAFWRRSNYDTMNWVSGGAINTDPIIGDPKFTDFNNEDFTLAMNSPCIDAGPPASQYNDHNGSRNDIGMFGGHNYIPDGRTTNKPIVLGLDVAPIAVPVGGSVTIESTGATVK